MKTKKILKERKRIEIKLSDHYFSLLERQRKIRGQTKAAYIQSILIDGLDKQKEHLRGVTPAQKDV